ncbi:type 4 prepilin-like protein leader peptide-processing enzyme [Moorella thermoacetica]|uniref:Prepilin leader peptidase/N-methyltransferase n=1 Tax=Neomoorella thermoacetica TaxID=1525 RepID=A0A1J5NI46_NEOTH|nr:type 4 prepilin-like protein leader peptide-processing enzyme [Moorella thermoacetica]
MQANVMVMIFFIMGLLGGSFLNVVIYRLPRGETVILGRSHCPTCGITLNWYDLVPVLSFFILKGRCRNCRAAISRRYPLVEILSALLFVIIFSHYGMTAASIKYIFLFALLLAAAFIDLDYYVIPDELVLTGLTGGVILDLAARDISISSAMIGAGAAGAFFLILSMASRGGVGGGDIKLAAVIGLFLGWPLTPLAILFASLIGGVTGLVLLLSRKKRPRDVLPFAPFLGAGTFVALLAGRAVMEWYISTFII